MRSAGTRAARRRRRAARRSRRSMHAPRSSSAAVVLDGPRRGGGGLPGLADRLVGVGDPEGERGVVEARREHADRCRLQVVVGEHAADLVLLRAGRRSRAGRARRRPGDLVLSCPPGTPPAAGSTIAVRQERLPRVRPAHDHVRERPAGARARSPICPTPRRRSRNCRRSRPTRRSRSTRRSPRRPSRPAPSPDRASASAPRGALRRPRGPALRLGRPGGSLRCPGA